MGRTENQKLKLLYLKELFERQSDEEHLLSMQDILDALLRSARMPCAASARASTTIFCACSSSAWIS